MCVPASFVGVGDGVELVDGGRPGNFVGDKYTNGGEDSGTPGNGGAVVLVVVVIHAESSQSPRAQAIHAVDVGVGAAHGGVEYVGCLPIQSSELVARCDGEGDIGISTGYGQCSEDVELVHVR